MINSLIISNSLLSSKFGHERLFVDIEISRHNRMLYGTVPLKSQIQGIHDCLPCVVDSHLTIFSQVASNGSFVPTADPR
jgi:hypothetical protein